MKVLLFTHEQDIDGMGCAILGKCAFNDFDYIPCKTFDITAKVKEQIDNGNIYNYNAVFVTDLCVKEPVLGNIANDQNLKDKFLILDHHKSEIDEGNNKYPFVNIVVKNKKGLASGTSLFYDYLINNKYIESNQFFNELVELTRQYDTWEWKNIYNNEKARMLHILFENIGYQSYFDMIMNMTSQNNFEFNDWQLRIIDDFNKNLKSNLTKIVDNIIVKNLSICKKNYCIGFVKSPYKYRNDIPEFIKENNEYNIDAVAMIMLDRETVSYRSIKDVDVSAIATYFGGKGHHKAASNPKDDKKFVKLLHSMKN